MVSHETLEAAKALSDEINEYRLKHWFDMCLETGKPNPSACGGCCNNIHRPAIGGTSSECFFDNCVNHENHGWEDR